VFKNFLVDLTNHTNDFEISLCISNNLRAPSAVKSLYK